MRNRLTAGTRSPAFLLTDVVVVATPGAGAILTITAGLSRGPLAALVAAYGVCAGLLRDRVLSRPRLVERIQGFFAAAFAALGLRLAFETR